MIYTKWFGPTGTVSEVELIELDLTGLECPMPLLKAKRALNAMEAGQQLRVLATDQGSVRDFRVFAEQSGHLLLASDEAGGGVNAPAAEKLIANTGADPPQVARNILSATRILTLR